MDAAQESISMYLSDDEHTNLAKIFKLLGDEGRLKIVLACMNEPRAVCCLSEIAGLSQSLTSHHLRALKDMRILKSRRQGRQMFYELDDDHIRCVLQDMIVHVREPH
ncbi:metalloregulator ArsR/SmtB family transcription factor [Sansalvadorimonas sp. 2012CJ34-2]|uniref:Metalloregulator ArsR/SmtB family transcription factor n=1 Tax=Parendozoicomonas callyspongiae TaxID=2942213 RepID=A0ABT0PH38_9GAMM|nr:metalloregulator ArsR/SmtB family transcription factor [Sansalvadorimonas sp. 2012CJ34-2]MCL6270692.1 metalloregulator ArsR/SmtB family transcription factor [Sansalvadorimonas sp. 2012CJ34-2]